MRKTLKGQWSEKELILGSFARVQGTGGAVVEMWSILNIVWRETNRIFSYVRSKGKKYYSATKEKRILPFAAIGWT